MVVVPAGNRHDNTGDGHSSKSNKLQDNKNVSAASADFGREAVEKCDKSKSENGYCFVGPDAGVHRIGSNQSADKVFSENNGNDGGRTGLQHNDGAPREQETSPLAVNLAQVDLRAPVQRYSSSQLGITGRACPSKCSSNDPYYQSRSRGSRIDVDLRRRRKDAGSNNQSHD